MKKYLLVIAIAAIIVNLAMSDTIHVTWSEVAMPEPISTQGSQLAEIEAQLAALRLDHPPYILLNADTEKYLSHSLALIDEQPDNRDATLGRIELGFRGEHNGKIIDLMICFMAYTADSQHHEKQLVDSSSTKILDLRSLQQYFFGEKISYLLFENYQAMYKQLEGQKGAELLTVDINRIKAAFPPSCQQIKRNDFFTAG